MRDYNQLVKKARAALQWMKQPDSTYQEDIVTMTAVVDALEVAEREVRRLKATATTEREVLVRWIAVAMSNPTLREGPAMGHYEDQARRVAAMLDAIQYRAKPDLAGA